VYAYDNESIPFWGDGDSAYENRGNVVYDRAFYVPVLVQQLR